VAARQKTLRSLCRHRLRSHRWGVSWISPIATVLLKAQAGDVVTMRTPRGTEELEIIAIR